MVVAEHAAESLTTAHAPDGLGGAGQGRDDRVAESLVLPLGVLSLANIQSVSLDDDFRELPA